MQQDSSSSEESWLEEQCIREIHTQNEECEREYVRHRDSSLGTVWGAFQDSATAVAQLYRERSSNAYPDTGALWLPFQTAAGTVTTLYKESCDGLKRTSDAAVQCGYQRRARELAEWARSKKRRMIRREDLLAYLAGKQLNPNRRSPRPEPLQGNSGSNVAFNASTGSGHHHASQLVPAATQQQQQQQQNQQQQQHPQQGALTTTTTASTNESAALVNDLHTFKEALILRPRNPELFAFVANEITRHCKRPGSPIDDKMDVCHYGSKRQRFM